MTRGDLDNPRCVQSEHSAAAWISSRGGSRDIACPGLEAFEHHAVPRRNDPAEMLARCVDQINRECRSRRSEQERLSAVTTHADHAEPAVNAEQFGTA